MGYKVTLDLNSLLQKLQELSVSGPSILEQASAMGFVVPGSFSKYIGMLGVLAQGASKFVPQGGGSLSFPGLPDTGPPGKGRLNYLRKKSRYKDEDVVRSLNSVLSTSAEGVKKISETIDFTMSLLYPGPDKKSDEQVRKAVDQVLEYGGMEEDLCDKFGDLIYYCLNTIESKEE